MKMRKMDWQSDLAEEEKNSPKIRGQRVRYVRDELLRLSREDFSVKYDLPAATLQNWEVGKYGGLTEKGAQKLISIFAQEGVPCSVEWLLFGIGSEPVRPGMQMNEYFASSENKISAGEGIAQELRLFHQLYKNAVDAIVGDYSMEPCFLPGDHVAGIRLFSAEFNKAIGNHCIVQLTNGEVLIRKLERGSQTGQYILLGINPLVETKAIVLNESQIFSLAPIVWLRRPM